MRHAVFDFNGTLALDGALLPGLASRFRKLAGLLPVTVLTADTFGTAAAALRHLPVTLHTVRTGRDKAAFVTRWRSAATVAIGNGNNDTAMFRLATLSIAVLRQEGLSPATLRAATLVVASPTDAMDSPASINQADGDTEAVRSRRGPNAPGGCAPSSRARAARHILRSKRALVTGAYSNASRSCCVPRRRPGPLAGWRRILLIRRL